MTDDQDAPELGLAPEAPALPRVAQSEADLLAMARALVAGPDGSEDMWSLLCGSRVLPPKIGPTCAALLEDTLRLAWRSLWQRGGTRPKLSPSGTRGRLWERYPVTPLEFSAATVELLRWLVASSFAAPPSTLPILAPAKRLTIGDQLMIYFALDAAKLTPALRAIAAQPFVQASPLAWLGFAPHLAGGRVPAFDSVVTGAGAIVLEALSDRFAKRWFADELAKRTITDPAELLAIGTAQDAVLGGFFEACDKHRRRDLASFVIDAAALLLDRNLSYHTPAQLNPSTPLSERAAARASAGALLRAVVRWSAWDQQHRGVRFIDDDYQAAQLVLARFERIGSAGVARVQGWLAELAALSPSDTVSPA